MKVTVEIKDYSQPKQQCIRVHNSWCDGEKVELQIKDQYYTVDAAEFISAIKKGSGRRFSGMNTLDEVIKVFETGILFSDKPYDEAFREFNSDALHYLKEYKNTDENYKKAIAHVTEVIDHYEKMVADYLAVNNPALTWSELKQMEGKPVWVEVYDPIDEKTGWHTASWKLIEFINDEYFDVRDSDGEQECFYKSENDCYCWQAYRKERK